MKDPADENSIAKTLIIFERRSMLDMIAIVIKETVKINFRNMASLPLVYCKAGRNIIACTSPW